ncbi:MAG: SCO family protein [Hyphomonadaceae bacterium]
MPPNVETPRRNLTGAAVPALAAAALAGLGALLIVSRNGEPAPAGAPVVENCILEGIDAVGGPIDLVDTNGAAVTQADFAGQPVAVYFGFTNCPFACPVTMQTLAAALAEANAPDIQPVLISLDPERDTPERMGAYAATDGFPSGLIGLTGSAAQVEAAKAAFRVFGNRVPIEGAAPDVYDIDHSSLLYIMDGQWRTVAAVRTVQRANEADPRSPLAAVPPENMAACIAAGLERARTAGAIMGNQRG